MKISYTKLTAKSFRNFNELTYKIGSGQVYGRSGEGKTNLLTAMAACFVNSGLDGKKLVPLPDDTKTGWVKLEYELDGEHQEAYRTWTRTDTGFTSSSSITKGVQKSLFLAIANPLYIFALDTSDRIDLLLDSHYYDFVGDLATEIPSSLASVEMSNFIDEIGKISLVKLRGRAKDAKAELKANVALKAALDAKLDVLSEIVTASELKAELSEQLTTVQETIMKAQNSLRMIEHIYDILLKNAVEAINGKLYLTRFTEDGKVVFDEKAADRLSSGEKLECGLEIANAIAGRYNLVPPTLVDNATAYGHSNIDLTLFPNLSQIIYASYADVDLCEHDKGHLWGLDKGWKVKAADNFRPEVEIEIISV